MQVINMLFLKIVGMGLTAGIVIGVVLLVRLLLRRLPKSFAYMLWIVVAFRLIVPFSADADISIFNLFERGDINNGISMDREMEAGMGRDAGSLPIADRDAADDIGRQARQDEAARNNLSGAGNDTESILTEKSGTEKNYLAAASYLENVLDNKSLSDVRGFCSSILNDDSHVSIMALIWLTGIMTLVSYTVVSYIWTRRKIRYSVRLYDNIYECDRIRSPFVFGMIRPRIYLPFRLSGVEQQCILAHEKYHIARWDHLIRNFAYVLVIVYWFHPLVWIAYRLMCIDMEMSCDEKIIAGFSADMRKEYSRLLLAFATNKRQFPVSPLAFGEENTMKRIKNVLCYKRTAKWKMAGGAVVIMLTMAACATDASTDEVIVPVPDRSVTVENALTDTLDLSERDIGNDGVNNNVTMHHSERNHADDQGKQRHMMEHHQAQWAENSMCDMELCSLDYADSEKIIFHISSGLFQYSLQEQRITQSIDLKALHCQEVQTGGECRVTVYHDSDSHLRAVIAPYPYSDEDSYVYDLESDVLFAYDESLLENYTVFNSLVSKYDLPEEEKLKGWRHAENILPLGDHSYGVLRWETIELGTMYYEAGDQKWELFHKEQATLPRQSKQDDSYYQSIAMYSGKDVVQCQMDYRGLYNMHDYAGVCALSTGLEYSDEMQKKFSERSDELLPGEEVSHSEDMMEYLFRYSYKEDGVEESDVYVNFKYIEGEGWRAEGLPSAQSGHQ